MASKTTRVAALLLALLFFVTTVGLSGMVLWQMWKDDQAKKQTTDISKALNDAQKQQQDSSSTNQQGAKMQGTQLQNFTPLDKVDQLKVEDVQVGTGEEVKPGATVKAHYTGAVVKTGKIFQSSHDQPGDKPIEFSLNQVIPGWTEGVPGMKVGGKRRLIIPAAKAYGDQSPSPDIPANADLVFDIELAEVKNP